MLFRLRYLATKQRRHPTSKPTSSPNVKTTSSPKNKTTLSPNKKQRRHPTTKQRCHPMSKQRRHLTSKQRRYNVENTTFIRISNIFQRYTDVGTCRQNYMGTTLILPVGEDTNTIQKLYSLKEQHTLSFHEYNFLIKLLFNEFCLLQVEHNIKVPCIRFLLHI